mgnify:CR=1 FL=1
MKTKEVPVLLLTGYLGSGKTTLVNHILSNERGIKFAVIVNDIGEVNIDADLIQKGGIVGKKDDSLVALQNGCICCTLKMDLIEQINDILKMKKPHPCGSQEWLVLRVGMDFKLRCQGCGHEVMLPRSKAEKSIRKILREEGTE